MSDSISFYNSPNYWDTMPDETSQLIFSFADPITTVRSLSLVSRNFNLLSCDQGLWKLFCRNSSFLPTKEREGEETDYKALYRERVLFHSNVKAMRYNRNTHQYPAERGDPFIYEDLICFANQDRTLKIYDQATCLLTLDPNCTERKDAFERFKEKWQTLKGQVDSLIEAENFSAIPAVILLNKSEFIELANKVGYLQINKWLGKLISAAENFKSQPSDRSQNDLIDIYKNRLGHAIEQYTSYITLLQTPSKLKCPIERFAYSQDYIAAAYVDPTIRNAMIEVWERKTGKGVCSFHSRWYELRSFEFFGNRLSVVHACQDKLLSVDIEVSSKQMFLHSRDMNVGDPIFAKFSEDVLAFADRDKLYFENVRSKEMWHYQFPNIIFPYCFNDTRTQVAVVYDREVDNVTLLRVYEIKEISPEGKPIIAMESPIFELSIGDELQRLEWKHGYYWYELFEGFYRVDLNLNPASGSKPFLSVTSDREDEKARHERIGESIHHERSYKRVGYEWVGESIHLMYSGDGGSLPVLNFSARSDKKPSEPPLKTED